MNITTERLIEIENEREQTLSDPLFQEWMKNLRVSVAYKNQEPRYRAKDMNIQYDFQKLFSKTKSHSYIHVIIKPTI